MRILKTAGMLAIVAAAILLAGCSLGSTASAPPTPTATATSAPAPEVPTPTSGFTTFTSSDGVYGLNYPSAWGKVAVTKSPVVNGVAFYSPDATSYFVVVPLNESVSSDQFTAFASTFADGFGATGTQISPSATTTTFAGKTWAEVNGATTVKGTPSEIKVYGTALGNNSLFLVLIWPTANGSQINTAALQPMLNSFTLLKQS